MTKDKKFQKEGEIEVTGKVFLKDIIAIFLIVPTVQ
jgi:hypothetical protein